MHSVNATDLPGSTSRQFEGYRYGDVNVSFFVSATPPGRAQYIDTTDSGKALSSGGPSAPARHPRPSPSGTRSSGGP